MAQPGPPSLMEREPQCADLVAEMYVTGHTNQQIADALQQIGFKTHKDTITDYKRHVCVRPKITKLIEERTHRIVSRVDNAIIKRLETDITNIDTETLLKIRKEMLPERIEIKTEDNRNAIIDELFDETDSDPKKAQQLMDAMERAAEKD